MLRTLFLICACTTFSLEETLGSSKECPAKALLTIPCKNECTNNTDCGTDGLICCEGGCKFNDTTFYRACVRPDLCAGYCKNGTCTEITLGVPSCICHEGFKGDRCDQEKTKCDWTPCKNGGICRNRKNDYTCFCQVPYRGKNCERKVLRQWLRKRIHGKK